MRQRIQIALVITLFLVVVPILITQIKQSAYANQLPLASFAHSPAVPAPSQMITFDASASYDADGRITRYRWDFGDGNVTAVAGSIITHSYPVDGGYTVELTVTDNNGATSASSAVIEVSTEVYFRVSFYGTTTPMSNVEVTMYYYSGSAWMKAPVGSDNLEIRYDSITQPDLANTPEEKYRNPGYTASILRQDASNIGFDVHPSNWKVYFEFKMGDIVAYWPNQTTRVYTYNNGIVEPHDYDSSHDAEWDPTAGTYVIRAKNIPSCGVSPSQTHPIIVGIFCPPPAPKYYLTVKTDPLGIATIPGQGWYSAGTNVALTAPQYVNVSSDTRYRFNYWDVDGTSRGSGVNPITVSMNANHTATAHYILQYTVTFAQTGLSSDATGTVATINSAPKTFAELPYTLWVDTGSLVTYSYNSIVSSSISGKQYRLSNVSGPSSPITVTNPATVTGNYATQYRVTFAQTGLDSTATGTVVTANGNPKTYTQLPYSLWVDSDSPVTYSYTSSVASTSPGKRFRLNSVTGPATPITVTAPTTVTGNYVTQYSVTFAQTGLDSTASGTIVTANGNGKTFAELPYILWADSGNSIAYTYNSPVPSSSPNKQFRLNSVTGPSSPVTIVGATTVTGNYIIQYQVTFAQSGLDSTASGTVATIDENSKTYSDLPFSKWVDSGSSVAYSYSSFVSSTTTGKRFRLDTVDGPASPITVTSPVTATGNYVTQYSVTFSQTGLDSTAIGTVVMVSGSPKTYGDLPCSIWADASSSVSYSYSSPVSSSVSGKRFRINNVSGSASPITVSAPTTVTGNYISQYSITFTQTGLDSTAAGIVVTVGGNPQTYADLPYSVWADSGSTIFYFYDDEVISTVLGKKFKLTGVSGPSSPITVTTSTTVTGNFKTQYKVTFDQTGVGADFTGAVVTIDSVNYGRSSLPLDFWWDSSSSHSFYFISPLVVNENTQYNWSSTSGLSNLQSGTLAITGSGSVIGNYIMANRIIFDQVGVSTDYSGTVVTVDSTPYTVGNLPAYFMWQVGTVHTFAFQSPLDVSTNLKRYVWTSTSGLSNLQTGSITVSAYGSIIGKYKTQYYLSLETSPPSIDSPAGQGWYDFGTSAPISTDQYVPGGSRYRFAGWITGDMSEIADPSSSSTTVFMDKGKTVTANYVHQYLVTFDTTGLSSDVTGPVLTINTTVKTFVDLPYSTWVDAGGKVFYSYETYVSSTVSGKRFRLTGVSGPSSPITVNADTTVTASYVVQYFLTVSSPYGTTGGQDWYDIGGTAYATLNVGMVTHSNDTRHVFTNWNGDASGTNYVQSGPITMNVPKIAVAGWKTQYCITFSQTGLDSSASGTVVTVNGAPKTYSTLPHPQWADASTTVTYLYSTEVSSSNPGKKFILVGVTGFASPIPVTGPSTVVGNYKTQYKITFNKTGVGTDFTGTIVTIDSVNYNGVSLPRDFWWDRESAHNFVFYSPLVVDSSKQYDWVSTTGLSNLQSGAISVTTSGSVTGNYVEHGKREITFDQTGVNPDFKGTVIVVDGANYNVTDLPVSFWWDSGSSHSFTFQSPLVVAANSKQYVWTSTTGLSTSQGESIIVSVSGNIVGNYKTQYYLALATSPPGVDSPSGAGWYDANAYATVSTDAFVDIVPSSSRYRFNGWTTPDMAEIADPTRSPTTALMDKAKTVTANYAVQYAVTFSYTGVGDDFLGTIVIIDANSYSCTGLPAAFWWDKDSVHTYAFQSPLVVTPFAKQYVLSAVTGLSTLPSGSITVATSGSVTGNYKTQYYLTVASVYDTPTPASGYFDAGTGITASVTSPVSGTEGTRYVCTGWTGTGSAPPSGTGTTTTFTMNQPSSITWNWKTQHYLTVRTQPSGLVTIPGQGWYDVGSGVQLAAPPVTGYLFDHWDVDGASRGTGVNPITVTMNAAHTATAHYSPISPPAPLSVTISPTSANVYPGEPVPFTAKVSGGIPSYSYQWYLGGNLVPGATSINWTFTPTAPGTYFVYVKVTDANNSTAQSNVAIVTVMFPPVGGHSVSLAKPVSGILLTCYVALLAMFGATISFMRRKRKQPLLH